LKCERQAHVAWRFALGSFVSGGAVTFPNFQLGFVAVFALFNP
jgi:hypothetical protein